MGTGLFENVIVENIMYEKPFNKNTWSLKRHTQFHPKKVEFG